jgi:hypothetical protein
MIVKENELLFNEWQYKQKPIEIIPKKKEARKLPETLYKYYPLNEFSVDAFTKKYLYASCQFELNDPLDCMSCLISYAEAYEKKKEEMLKKGKDMPSLKEFVDSNVMKLSRDFGVISLTENQDDLNMWTHYASNHEGFVVCFNSTFLKNEKELTGPFQINYSENWEPFPLKDNKYNELGFLYLTNIKSKKWKPEYEWRFLRVKKNMSIPKIRMDAKSIENRKSYYDQRCIDEITIGMNFWIDILKSKFTDSIWKIVFEMKEGINLYKYQLLNFLADQNEIRVSTFESKVMPDFSLSKFQIKITKLESDLEFRIERVSNHK